VRDHTCPPRIRRDHHDEVVVNDHRRRQVHRFVGTQVESLRDIAGRLGEARMKVSVNDLVVDPSSCWMHAPRYGATDELGALISHDRAGEDRRGDPSTRSSLTVISVETRRRPQRSASCAEVHPPPTDRSPLDGRREARDYVGG
jgi:hypothetical protein